MSTPARRRLMQDLIKLHKDSPYGISGAPTENNIMIWHAIIFGPQDTSFEDGTFELLLEFSEEYPIKPPNVKFVSKIFHPNVHQDGRISLDILKIQDRWSPTYDVTAILLSIQSLLDDPNPNSGANVLAAKMYLENRQEYEKRVRQMVELSWSNLAENKSLNEKRIGGSSSVTTTKETRDGERTKVPETDHDPANWTTAETPSNVSL